MYAQRVGVIRDLSGQTFGSWTVESFDRVAGRNGARWNVRCVCGERRSVFGKTLTQGTSQSCGCTQRLARGEASCRSVFRNYKRGALKRGYAFALSLDEFRSLTSADCYYCGAAPAQSHGNAARFYNGTYTYNGIDRLDPTVGYVSGNCVPCCGLCNRMKGRLSHDEFIRHVLAVASSVPTSG